MTYTARPVPLGNVRITDRFWSPRQQLMMNVTIPYMEKILRDQVEGAVVSHSIANFRIAAGQDSGAYYGVVFLDSDVYKWLEAAAYSLFLKPDAGLEKRVDEIVDTIAKAQMPDGYLNTYFQLVEPENRWQNLLECHELYCAGHMLEAAVALYESLGKRGLLAVAEKLAQHIINRFGEGQSVGIPGHQEIEIGLMRLYTATGKAAYLHMAQRFLDMRGQDPEYFIKNTPAHPDMSYGDYDLDPTDTDYNQSYAPVREQREARGHAVRCAYMLTAMAAVAAATGDAALKTACERMFENITERQMYVTGAIGSTAHHESFAGDFNLPNDRGYGETCASVAMAFFAQRMLLLSPEGKYADLLERELYNAALAGMQLDGQRFFYVNPLEVNPGRSGVLPELKHVLPQRPQWYSCACCPPNLARLISSLGQYLWSETEDTLYSHLFVGNKMHSGLAAITLETEYPWQGHASYQIRECKAQPFALAIRIPHYVDAGTLVLTLNGAPINGEMKDGFCRIHRPWQPGDQVELCFPLECRRVYADERVAADVGLVALARGPIVYCLEGVDNATPLSALILPKEAALSAQPYEAELLGGIVPLEAEGQQELDEDGGRKGPARIRAIPYYAWSNRGETEMRVWLRE